MTREEWIVIAAAAAVFVLINIVMWSVIAAKSKREKRRGEVPPDISNALLKASEGLDSASTSGETAAPKQPAQPVRRRTDFTVVTSIIITDTTETLD